MNSMREAVGNSFPIHSGDLLNYSEKTKAFVDNLNVTLDEALDQHGFKNCDQHVTLYFDESCHNVGLNGDILFLIRSGRDDNGEEFVGVVDRTIKREDGLPILSDAEKMSFEEFETKILEAASSVMNEEQKQKFEAQLAAGDAEVSSENTFEV